MKLPLVLESIHHLIGLCSCQIRFCVTSSVWDAWSCIYRSSFWQFKVQRHHLQLLYAMYSRLHISNDIICHYFCILAASGVAMGHWVLPRIRTDSWKNISHLFHLQLPSGKRAGMYVLRVRIRRCEHLVKIHTCSVGCCLLGVHMCRAGGPYV